MVIHLLGSGKNTASRCIGLRLHGFLTPRCLRQGVFGEYSTNTSGQMVMACNCPCQRRTLSSAPGTTLLGTKDRPCNKYNGSHNDDDNGIEIPAQGAFSVSPPSSLGANFSSTNSDFVRSDKRHPRERMGFLQCKKVYAWEGSLNEPGGLRLVFHQEGTFLERLRVFGMPRGYPDSCAIGLRRYFLLSMCSSAVSSFASSIGYQSILNGFFLGSSPQLWMLKDLLPALFSAYLANRVISYENRPKFWFFVSVGLHNLSVIAEMIVPSLLSQHLLFGAIVTSSVRQSASLMFLVTRASAIQHFAVSNNFAEITKKFNSFGMVIYTIFTALGIVYTSIVTSLVAQLVTVVFCCGLNLLLSYLSMSKVAFRILNVTTLSVVLREYVRKEEGDGVGANYRHIPTPKEVSERIGLRMVDTESLEYNDRISLLCVSPPVSKLHVRFDKIEEDVLYVCSSGMFLLGIWEEAAPMSMAECLLRRELPAACRSLWSRLLHRTVAKDRFTRNGVPRRLVLLIHQECDELHLLTAYLLAYTALLYHAKTLEELTEFLSLCNQEQSVWLRHGAELREELKKAGWDVKQLALDPPDFRLSSLRFAMRPV